MRNTMTESQIQKVFEDLRNAKVLKCTSKSTDHDVVYSLEFVDGVFKNSWQYGRITHTSELYESEIKDYLETDFFTLLDKSYYEENTMQKNCTKHKHFDLITQWASNPEGFVVEFKDPSYKDMEWGVTSQPSWIPAYEYRLTPKKQKVTKWQWLCKDNQTGIFFVTFWPHASEEAVSKTFPPEVKVIQKIEESAKDFPVG